MALPGRDQTFAFENCRDMLSKLDREIDRYTTASNNDRINEMKDIAFNASVTAWQLCDWVFHDLTDAQRDALKVQSLSDLQARAREECRALYLCRQVATASKHWHVTHYPDPDVNLPRWHIYFIDGSEEHDAAHIFEIAAGFWTQFIYQNKIAQSTAASLAGTETTSDCPSACRSSIQ